MYKAILFAMLAAGSTCVYAETPAAGSNGAPALRADVRPADMNKHPATTKASNRYVQVANSDKMASASTDDAARARSMTYKQMVDQGMHVQAF